MHALIESLNQGPKSPVPPHCTTVLRRGLLISIFSYLTQRLKHGVIIYKSFTFCDNNAKTTKNKRKFNKNLLIQYYWNWCVDELQEMQNPWKSEQKYTHYPIVTGTSAQGIPKESPACWHWCLHTMTVSWYITALQMSICWQQHTSLIQGCMLQQYRLIGQLASTS